MKKVVFLKGIFAILLLVVSCEYPIKVKVKNAEPLLAVDGWINNQDNTQIIRLTSTLPYFQNTPAPALGGATVKVLEFDANNTLLNTYTFQQVSNGNYEANFKGEIGRKYQLQLTYQGENFVAETWLKRVPPIDSMNSEYRKARLGQPKGYYVNVFGRDIPGIGDFYRFRVWRNGVMFNRPENLTIMSDQNIDGLPFIPPIRISFNPFFDSNGLEPYKVGDVVRAEVLSIDENAFRFFEQLSIQVNNSGLFARPIANVPTNVQNTNPRGKKAVGYFYASAVSSREITIQKDSKEDEP
ncbi:MAG: DUF4249 domain-containing protein [Microscillaceae bacterium]|nr:DUF4249 domain-containing protein [Microscillaceae bacterium]MDW8459929.1 DUF4249 domain-containing protein [Cytophagales bacterium]